MNNRINKNQRHRYIWIYHCPQCREIYLYEGHSKRGYKSVHMLRRYLKYFGECETCKVKNEIKMYQSFFKKEQKD